MSEVKPDKSGDRFMGIRERHIREPELYLKGTGEPWRVCE